MQRSADEKSGEYHIKGRGIIRLFVSICLLLVVIAVSTPLVTAVTLGAVHGRVTDTTGRVIAGARVTLIGQGSGSRRNVYTDINGQYLFSDLAPAKYSLDAFHDGYGQSTPILFEASSSGMQFDVELQASAHGLRLPSANSWSYLLLTALLPILLALFFTRPMQMITYKLWQFVQKTTYLILAPRFPNRIGIPGYKKRLLRSDLAYIENLVGPPELKVHLERAFAPITVVSESAKTSIDPFAFAAAHSCFIMLGGPGTGKTTLMKSLVTNIVKGTVSEELKGLVPVFIVLRELAQVQHTVEQGIVAALARFGLSKSESFVEAALSKGRLLIVLDGLDEVGANRSQVAAAIRTFCRSDTVRDHPNRVIVTCREMSYRVRDLNDVIPVIARVDPFTPQHMRVFLRGWPPYQDRIALKLYGELEKAPPVRESCRNPLLLSILAGLYLQSSSFDLPSSRDEFYETAVNELLVNRPARRGLNQQYSERDKWQLLQRLSLHALQVSTPSHDEEKLSRGDIYTRAREVFGEEHNEAAFRELLNELVDVNGILKYVGEDSFTLGHRTFQEYLAAREARRMLSVDDVLTKFAHRPELYEVISFYAGLLTNIPQLNQLLRNLLKRDNHQLAGRCLLSASEIPSQDVVERVVAMLSDSAKLQIAQKGDNLTELEILSFLSQKPDTAFECARVRLTELVTLLLESNAEKGAAGLVSILATREETALKLIPGLLESDSEEWRIAGVLLLFSLGTDTALDGLIQLLGSQDPIVKHEAAVLVSGLVERRSKDLLMRAELLPEQSDLSKWPLEKYIPGRLALPILEGLALQNEDKLQETADSGNMMESACKAIAGGKDKDWQNLRRDIYIRDTLLAMGRAVAPSTSFCVMLFYLVIALFSIKHLSNYQAAVVRIHPLGYRLHEPILLSGSFFSMPSLMIKDAAGRSQGILIQRPGRLPEIFAAIFSLIVPCYLLYTSHIWMKRRRKMQTIATKLSLSFMSLAPKFDVNREALGVNKSRSAYSAWVMYGFIWPLYSSSIYFPTVQKGGLLLTVLCLGYVILITFLMIFFRTSSLVRNKYFEVADAARRIADEGATLTE